MSVVALSYVVLANHDHVSCICWQENSRANATPFYRGRRRMTDCVNFLTLAAPGGSLHWRRCWPTI